MLRATRGFTICAAGRESDGRGHGAGISARSWSSFRGASDLKGGMQGEPYGVRGGQGGGGPRGADGIGVAGSEASVISS
jgi:hypothetical protein